VGGGSSYDVWMARACEGEGVHGGGGRKQWSSRSDLLVEALYMTFGWQGHVRVRVFMGGVQGSKHVQA